MSQPNAILIAAACYVFAIVYFFGIQIWRGRSRSHSQVIFWLWVTAPLVSIVFMLLAIVVAFLTRVR